MNSEGRVRQPRNLKLMHHPFYPRFEYLIPIVRAVLSGILQDSQTFPGDSWVSVVDQNYEISVEHVEVCCTSFFVAVVLTEFVII